MAKQINSVTYPRKYYNDRENWTNKNQQQRKTQGLSDNMRKSVSKLKKKEFICKKGSYKDDHLYVQTSTKFFYNSKQKNPVRTPRMSAHWETGASLGIQTISPVDLQFYLGWLGFLIPTHVLHMNVLINHEYSRMLHILLNLQYTSFHMFKFLLGP